jgi:hypothetical protein
MSVCPHLTIRDVYTLSHTSKQTKRFIENFANAKHIDFSLSKERLSTNFDGSSAKLLCYLLKMHFLKTHRAAYDHLANAATRFAIDEDPDDIKSYLKYVDEQEGDSDILLPYLVFFDLNTSDPKIDESKLDKALAYALFLKNRFMIRAIYAHPNARKFSGVIEHGLKICLKDHLDACLPPAPSN